MNRLSRLLPLAAALGLSACSLGGLLGGGKAPPTLLTLNPESAAPTDYARTASAGNAVTVSVPVIAKELRTVRVPVQISPTDVAYIKGAQWVDTPDRLFKDLVSETIRRTTGRVVLDPKQGALDPGILVSGQLQRFGFDAAQGVAIVSYDAAMTTDGGTKVQTRRFEAKVPAVGDASIGPALNQAANRVALDVANWIGG